MSDPAGAGRPHDNSVADWDARYAESDRMWSGEPNGLLVREVTGAPPGRAVDVGCGEGADAVWLAQRGWRVTAIDVSRVAVERGRSAAAGRGIEVDWRVADVLDPRVRGELGTFDLVAAFYPALRKDAGAVDALTSLVAPGGVLLFVHHLDVDRERALAHGFDPDDYVGPDDVAGALTGRPGWTIERRERVERDVREGAGAHHHWDGLVRSLRTS